MNNFVIQVVLKSHCASLKRVRDEDNEQLKFDVVELLFGLLFYRQHLERDTSEFVATF